MPIFSLPSEYGIGAIDKSAFEFVDFLEKSGQKYWQILPVGPTGYGDSPYQSFSTFAGNPYFIDLSEYADEKELKRIDFGNDEESIDYGKIYENRFKILRKIYENNILKEDINFNIFAEKNREWLDDYALFMALKKHFNGVCWLEWEKDIKRREESSLRHYKETLKSEIEFNKFIQYLFYKQWEKLKKYANNKGIKIIGDIPIYVAVDSVDVWSNPDLFQLDKNYTPTAVAGCPPDGFSPKGQLWGNPLYNWHEHKKDNYKWWSKRLKHSFSLYDVIRIDHFRGFDEYYSIPYGKEDAVDGHWEKGPGKDLFAKFLKDNDDGEIIAEDLGFITDSVKELLKECDFPGMKVLQFAFDSRDENSKNDYLPHNYPVKCIAYTGTHDNQTLKSWYKTISKEEQNMVRQYLCDFYTPDEELNKALISLVMRSSAVLSVIPMQDYLNMNDKARVNTPSTTENNWRWRIKKEMFSEKLAEEINKITKTYGR